MGLSYMGLDNQTRIEDLAVEIVGQCLNGQDCVYGSGILYLQKSGKRAAVLTAAHVVQEELLFLRLRFRNGQEENLAFDGSSTSEQIKRYDSTCAEDGDAAVILIAWRDWMQTLPEINVDRPQKADQIEIYGFPQSTLKLNKGKHREIRYMSGRITITPDESACSFQMAYDREYSAEGTVPENFFTGYSGAGLVTYRNRVPLIVGIFTKCMPQITQGNVILANSGIILRELLTEEGFDPNQPPSRFTIDCYTREFSPEVRDVLENQLKQLHLDETSFQDLTQYRIPALELSCEEQRHCQYYWCSRALGAVLLKILLGGVPEAWERVTLALGEDHVHIEQLCTEDDISTIVRKLIQSDEAFLQGRYENYTLFLIGNRERLDLSFMPKKGCRRIMGNIIRDQDQLCNQFSITDGDIKRISIALAENVQLLRYIEQGLGDESGLRVAKAREILMRELQKLWE